MRTTTPNAIAAVAVAWSVLALVSSSAQALPIYAARAGRTCANCHKSPTYEDPKGWYDPPEIAERKCSLSCSACHVNPTGGGLRNAAGRYYGQSTLAILPTQERSYSDLERELLPNGWINALRETFAWQPASAERAAGAPADKTIPSDHDEVLAGVGAGRRGGLTAFGRPFFGPSEYALWDGRYADLIADPFFTIGGDLRAAYWSSSGTFFPMQLDLHAALHPIEHLTAVGTLSGRGRVGGFETALSADTLPLFARNAFLMLHELPRMSYVKAGIFMPSFGVHLDDHTSFTRDFFEMDVSTSDDTVLGVEVGMAPNYPFANLSVFTNWLPGTAAESGLDGIGAAANAGWRAEGWSLSGHLLVKQRRPEARGSLSGAGLAWGFNPTHYLGWIPIAYVGELTVGERQIAGAGVAVPMLAMMHEVWVTPFNGINARLKYDLGSADLGVPQDLQHRLTLSLDVCLLPGVTLIAQARYLGVDGHTSESWDAFLTTHLWF